MIRNLISWFGALPTVAKVLVVLAVFIALGISVALSPFVVIAALLVLMLALFILVIQSHSSVCLTYKFPAKEDLLTSSPGEGKKG